MQLPTGGGKTACASQIILSHLNKRESHRAIFMAHLDTLVSDTHAKLLKAGVDAGYVQAGRPVKESARVQVCSIQTLHSRDVRPEGTLVIMDECHRANASTVRSILDYYKDAKLLGLTATPQRGDGQPLGDMFEHMELGPPVSALVEDGFLVPSVFLSPAMELPEGQIAEDPVSAYAAKTPNTRAIVFARSVAEATELSARFAAAGFPSETITGATKRSEREGLRHRIDSGKTMVLVGVDVFTEGFDCPSIETVILARKIKTLGRWFQSIGRGLRPYHPVVCGHSDCLEFPEVGLACNAHLKKKVCTVIDLFGMAHVHGTPDQRVNWTLDGKPNTRANALSLRTCTECMAVFAHGPKYCPRCGVEQVVTPRELKQYENLHAELTPRTSVKSCVNDRAYFDALVRVTRSTARAMAIFQSRWGRPPVLRGVA